MEFMKKSVDAIVANIQSAKDNLDEVEVDEFVNLLVGSENIFVIGAGRSGFVAKAFAMRLKHLGLSSHVVGETITPPIRQNDCIIAISGSGETKNIVTSVITSNKIGAKVLAVTGNPESSIGKIADTVLCVNTLEKEYIDMDSSEIKCDSIPIIRDECSEKSDMKIALTPLGTAFELSALILLDGLVCELMNVLKQSEHCLKCRHANLE